MSMHSIGQAWAHWKHVSHLIAPYSSYRSWSRPRKRVATSAWTSGYLIVAFGSKSRRNVRLMPLTMPRPGTRFIVGASRDRRRLGHDEDRGRGDEEVQQRGRQQPLPGEAHQLVDPDPGEGGPHPDEDEHEDVGLAQEPQQSGHPVQPDIGDPEQRRDRHQVEQDKADDDRLPPRQRASRDEERRGQREGANDWDHREQDQQQNPELARVEARGDRQGPG